MPESKALIDTNILVFAYSSEHRFEAAASGMIREAADGNGHYVIAEQNLLEWYSVVTSVKRSEPRLTPEEAQTMLGQYARSRLRIVRPTAETHSLLIRLLNQAPLVQGKDIFDRYLAATALSNGIDTILTDNTKDFAGIPGLTAINPFTTK